MYSIHSYSHYHTDIHIFIYTYVHYTSMRAYTYICACTNMCIHTYALIIRGLSKMFSHSMMYIFCSCYKMHPPVPQRQHNKIVSTYFTKFHFQSLQAAFIPPGNHRHIRILRIRHFKTKFKMGHG